ncbi:sensor histidine kinase [Amycolatopsis sp. NPDC059027]|uniref:sensor histidine kinase n=1 Tax=unclassified Amycolatopsis TaxID=2618356 RepID=UPI003671C111
MTRLWPWTRRLPSWVFDLAPVGLAALDTWLNAKHATPYEFSAAAIATLALLLRRSFPLTVLAITFPSMVVSQSVVPALIALYTVGCHYRNRWLLAGCMAAGALGYATPWPPMLELSHDDVLLGLIYSTMTAAAPVFLGMLARTGRELSVRIDEIEQAREQERLLIEQTTLARERTQLAREMHDVVSHQVSLIAVSAGALQVGAPDAGTKEAASTIRELSVNTLDELRHMVTLLRASGSQPTELTPQPTLAELERLIATSGIPVERHGELPTGLGAPQQRAIYRTIQEALTNARKHAPGASVTLHIGHTATEVDVTVVNGRPTRPTLRLPSAQHGLIGLRERAELLSGSFEAGPSSEGGYRVRLRLPLSAG